VTATRPPLAPRLFRTSLALYGISMLLPCTWTFDKFVLGYEFLIVSMTSLLSIEFFHPASLANPAYVAAIVFHCRGRRARRPPWGSRALALFFGLVAVVSGLTWAWGWLRNGRWEQLHLGYLVWQTSFVVGLVAIAAPHPSVSAPAQTQVP